MKITEISKEYLEKGGLIRRKGWAKDISISFNESATDLTLEDITNDDWELIEKSTQVWQPQYDEKYYYITTGGNVARDIFNPFFDKYKLSFKNCFKTRKEAQRMVEKIKIINKLKELSNINFGDDINELKYSIGYDIDTKKVCSSMNRFTRIIPFEVYFKTATDCQKAIDTIGEENLKKYYFDVEVEE